MLHLLMREFDLRILLTPTIVTSDNKASTFFDGQDVSIQTGIQRSAEAGATVTGSVYEDVGTLLRVRPHITKNNNVDLKINLEVSRIVPGSTATGNPTFDRREVFTHVVVKSGQTIMLSGIIRQEDFDEVRKVPLLGDIPLLGKLFRSIDKGTRNREMLVFITPEVMSTPDEVDAQMEEPLKTLKGIERKMGAHLNATGKGKTEGAAP